MKTYSYYNTEYLIIYWNFSNDVTVGKMVFTVMLLNIKGLECNMEVRVDPTKRSAFFGPRPPLP